MDRTAEVRWFFRRPPPGPLAGWFGGHAGPPETRSDHYLVLPGTDALGVKIRGGAARLELKLRPDPSRPLDLAAGIVGRLEGWQRWSFPRPAPTRLLPRLGLPRGLWIEVAKERRQVTIPFGGSAGTGCRVELTALRVRGQEWATFGFESFGAQGDLVPALEAAAKALFDAIDVAEPFGADCSCGYPGWLATL